MYTPKISIVIPVYNSEQHIKRCLISIRNQTLIDFEAIIFDDKSTDNTLEMVQDIIKNDARFKVTINQKNYGVGKTRNLALKRATGKYILFIDSDDWIAPTTCEVLFENAELNKLDVLEGDYRTVYEEEPLHDIHIHKSGSIQILSGIDYIEKQPFIGAVWNRLWLRDHLKKFSITFYEDISYGEDVYFSFNGIYNANRIGKINFTFYNYFQSENSLSRTVVKDQHLRGLLKLTEYFRNSFNNSQTKKQRKVFAKMLAKCMVHANKLLRNSESETSNLHHELRKETNTSLHLLGIKFLQTTEIHLLGRLIFLVSPDFYNFLFRIKTQISKF
ncbi:glycosyltransferase [uncultured Draconibacterium sp.]|uniref:glycosyltransferase family 2 protein n=1 Tax=uncultured Draconibacterium sp. TaxID=1573823 RepID=UPI002AA61B00|nr:glycosyltransferase [uncultured Draconibacterium sp.]